MTEIDLFDNDGRLCFFRVPASGTLLQGGYDDYRAFFNKGIFYQKESGYYAKQSPIKVSGSDEIIFTDRLSAVIDSKGIFWASVESNGVSKVLSFKSGLKLEASIPSSHVQMTNDLILSGIRCFFISGNDILTTTEFDGFSGYSSYGQIPFTAKLISVLPSNVNLLRNEFYATSQDGDGYKITSNISEIKPDYSYMSLNKSIFKEASFIYSLSEFYAGYIDEYPTTDGSLYSSFSNQTVSFETF